MVDHKQGFLGAPGKTCVYSGAVPAPVDLCRSCVFRSLRDCSHRRSHLGGVLERSEEFGPILDFLMTVIHRCLLLRKTYFGKVEGPSDDCDDNVFLRCLLTMSIYFFVSLCVCVMKVKFVTKPWL